MKCHSHDCSRNDIFRALGASWEEFYGAGNGAKPKKRDKPPAFEGPGVSLDEYAATKRLPVGFLRDNCGLTEKKRGDSPYIAMPYSGIPRNGEASPDHISTRYRVAMSGDKKVVSGSGEKQHVYGLQDFYEIAKQRSVIWVEGESDCHTLWFDG